MKKIVFWGGASHAKVLWEFLHEREFELVGIFDRNKNLSSPVEGVSLFHPDEIESRIKSFKGDLYFATAIGGSKGFDKIEIHEYLISKGLIPTILIHPNSFVSKHTTLGNGCQITSNVSIVTGVKMGRECLINTNSSVDHESTLGDGVHISAGVTVGAKVSIGDGSFIGMGASVMSHIKIGRNVVVGAGAVVIRDIPDNKLAYGVPARVIKENQIII